MEPDRDAVPPIVSIACQGGGSHAAFGAGVMHRLLADHGQRYRLSALSGTSGGAVNAVLAWTGLLQGGETHGPAEARRRLKGMWEDLGAADPADAVRNWWGQVFLNLPFTWEISPYALDLGVRDEMIAHLKRWAKLEANPKDPKALNRPALFVGATDVENGVAVAIRGDGCTVSQGQRLKTAAQPFSEEDVIASMAIPPIYKDVRRRGTAFWDGLFSINPPIYALTHHEPRPQEIWVIQINPQKAAHAPVTMRQITDRRNELSGNVSLNKELDMIETINRMLAAGRIVANGYRHITVRVVGIEEDESGIDLSLASKFNRDPGFLRALFERGEERATEFYAPKSERGAFKRRIRAEAT